jgi:septum formation protein
MQFILASQSPQRVKLLATLPYNFKSFPAAIDEAKVPYKNPKDKAKRIALAKAEAVAKQIKGEAIIIAADTFCLCKGQILEKPKSKAVAREMLELQSDKEIEAITGYAFIYQNDQEKNIKNDVVISKLHFRKLATSEIENYIAHQPVLTWSAAFSPAYDAGMALLTSSKGNLTAFTHGLPLNLVVDFIHQQLEFN